MTCKPQVSIERSVWKKMKPILPLNVEYVRKAVLIYNKCATAMHIHLKRNTPKSVNNFTIRFSTRCSIEKEDENQHCLKLLDHKLLYMEKAMEIWLFCFYPSYTILQHTVKY